MKYLLLIASLTICCAQAFSADKPPYLLHWGQSCDPNTIAKNINFIETERSFDGLIIQQNTLAIPLMLRPMSYSEMVKCLEPIKKDTFKKMKHNFLLVYWGGFKAGESVPDFFDDWTYIINNFKILAKLCRNYGYDGVFIDNEDYKYNYWFYPDNMKYKNKTLTQYHLQARLRGKQIMQAMCEVYPQIAAISLHGPYISCAESSTHMRGFMGSGDSFIAGSFIAGLIEGAGDKPKAYGVDGGELYDLNTIDQFEQSYQWRKFGIAAPATKCLFMDGKLKQMWPRKCSISYGVYDKEAPDKTNWSWSEWVQIKNPQLLKDRIRLSLTRCDKYVWFYTETTNWMITPQDYKTIPGLNQIPIDTWVTALREGRDEAKKARL